MKLTFNWLRGYWAKFVHLILADGMKYQQANNRSDETSKDLGETPVSRVYYSIPGRSFTGYIDKGRISKTNPQLPFSRR